MTELRDVTEADFASIIDLNDAEVQQTSPMDFERLRLLDRLSSYHKLAMVDGRVAAFLLAMREGVAYHNDNYNWFAARFTDFLYVDRIVIAASFSGRGIASTLYNDMIEYARLHGIKTIACEYNVERLTRHPERFMTSSASGSLARSGSQAAPSGSRFRRWRSSNSFKPTAIRRSASLECSAWRTSTRAPAPA